jgi:ankyrin repeat protein
MSLVDPILNAIFEGDCKKIDALLAGRDVNAGTAQDNLLRAALIGLTDAPNPNVVQHLINLGVNVNSKDYRGWTPLHFAARTKSPAADPTLSTACVKLLLEAGANVNAKDDEGLTPLHQSLAVHPVNQELIEILLAAGAERDILRKFVNVVASPDINVMRDLLHKYDRSEKM